MSLSFLQVKKSSENEFVAERIASCQILYSLYLVDTFAKA